MHHAENKSLPFWELVAGHLPVSHWVMLATVVRVPEQVPEDCPLKIVYKPVPRSWLQQQPQVAPFVLLLDQHLRRNALRRETWFLTLGTQGAWSLLESSPGTPGCFPLCQGLPRLLLQLLG